MAKALARAGAFAFFLGVSKGKCKRLFGQNIQNEQRDFYAVIRCGFVDIRAKIW